MFEKPTINDYLGRMRAETNRSLDVVRGEATAKRSLLGAKGLGTSATMVRALLELAETGFRQHLEKLLVTLRRTIDRGELDARDLRDTTVQYLQPLPQMFMDASSVAAVAQAINAGGVDKVVLEASAKMDEHLRLRVRQFDIGWVGPQEAAGDSFVNSGVIIGGVQQHSHGSSIAVQVGIDLAAARQAAKALATELAQVKPEVPIIDMRADVDTIMAQLGRSQPSSTVLREVGATLKTIAEGLVAGMLTQPALTALAALLTALGLS